MSRSGQTVQHDGEAQQFTNEALRVFVDFHNADTQGRIRLNCVGTVEDLSAHNIDLQVGQQLTLYSEDLEVDGTIEYSESEHLWVAVIDWDEIREVEETNPVEKQLFNLVEKFESILELLKADVLPVLNSEQTVKRHELEKLLDEAKRDLNDVRGLLNSQNLSKAN